jgi:hypothetical protein
MHKRLIVSAGVALLASVLAASPASATGNLFIPVSGIAFRVDAYSQVGVAYSTGDILNTSSNLTAEVQASLGHAEGNYNGFYVYGIGNGGTFSCTVWVLTTDGSVNRLNGPYNPTGYTSSTTATGVFSLFVQTSPAIGSYFYTMQCQLPPRGSSGVSSALIGVKPQN